MGMDKGIGHGELQELPGGQGKPGCRPDFARRVDSLPVSPVLGMAALQLSGYSVTRISQV